MRGTVKHRGNSVMVYGVFSFSGIGPLVKIDEGKTILNDQVKNLTIYDFDDFWYGGRYLRKKNIAFKKFQIS